MCVCMCLCVCMYVFLYLFACLFVQVCGCLCLRVNLNPEYFDEKMNIRGKVQTRAVEVANQLKIVLRGFILSRCSETGSISITNFIITKSSDVYFTLSYLQNFPSLQLHQRYQNLNIRGGKRYCHTFFFN